MKGFLAGCARVSAPANELVNVISSQESNSRASNGRDVLWRFVSPRSCPVVAKQSKSRVRMPQNHPAQRLHRFAQNQPTQRKLPVCSDSSDLASFTGVLRLIRLHVSRRFAQTQPAEREPPVRGTRADTTQKWDSVPEAALPVGGFGPTKLMLPQSRSDQANGSRGEQKGRGPEFGICL